MTAEAIEPLAPSPSPPALVVVTPRAYVPLQICVCGHETDAHAHHRSGDGCGVCGPVRCRHYRRRTGRGARRR